MYEQYVRLIQGLIRGCNRPTDAGLTFQQVTDHVWTVQGGLAETGGKRSTSAARLI